MFDTLVRHLRSSGLNTTYVRNFTDIDDKIIRVARQLGEHPSVVTERFINAYHEDTDALCCLRPTHSPRVSEHLPEIIALIQSLIDRGHAYESGGDVYFRVNTFVPYGRLSKRDFSQPQDADHQRKNNPERKEDSHDFALWKTAKEDEGSGARWPSPWGEGRPGWHIECSAMARKWLGDDFDIHGGGIDLIFPHHENEIAQSEASNGSRFARAWMHNGFININQKKASKSDADTYDPEVKHYFVFRNLTQRVHPEAIRLWILGTHYRSPLSFDVVVDEQSETNALGLKKTSFPLLEESERRVEYFYDTRARMNARAARAQNAAPAKDDHPIKRLLRSFNAAMDDDLNTAQALGFVSDLYKFANELCDANRKDPVETRVVLEALAHCSKVLGVADGDPAEFAARVRVRRAAERGIIPADIDALIDERAAARKAKNFERSDEIRGILSGLGIEVRDEGGGSVWRIL